MDKNILWGALLGFGLIVIGMSASGNPLAFISIPSLCIVVGGSLGATLMSSTTSEIRQVYETLKRRIKGQDRSPDPYRRIEILIELAREVRQHGILHLEEIARRTRDPFLRRALQLAVDGQGSDIRTILETELQTYHTTLLRNAQILETMGGYAPAMGLIGTLIGLVQMMGSLGNPELVGPAMASALITTFYGAILANLVCLPLAAKLRHQLEGELRLKLITVEGAYGLASLENALLMEQRLQSYLPRAA